MNVELSNKIRELMNKLSIPGVAIGVYNGGDVSTQGYGVTNIDHPIPVDDDTLFQIGSITKTFVGTMTMMLVDEGKLDLDTPVQTYLPEFKVPDEEASKKATIRHLFTHSAGWVGDWFPSGIEQGPDSVEHYVKTMIDDPQDMPLGESISYNNAGYNLAGRILEIVTGKVFSDLIKEMIFEPLGMTDTYTLPWNMMTKRFASGHTLSEKGIEVSSPWFIGRSSGPAGGIVSSVKDMVKYIKFHLGNDLLSKESLTALHTPQREYAPGHSIALTFWVDNTRSARSMGHGGGTVGQISLLTIVPDHDYGMILVTNSATGRMFNPKITNLALKEYIGVDTPELEFMELSDDELQDYAGEYEAKLTAMTVAVEDGKLTLSSRYLGGFPTADDVPETTEPSPPLPYGFYEKDHIKGLDASNSEVIAQFIREDGKVSMIRSGMRLHKRL
ncbi:beta-lactamase family protein [Candidatus Bathyarchaeota archaeon]|jgi:CubicO group peptidase (beta-lactamase class C family)|nr:beta-lactamase family protein [Candidatus Bathyarchaeota archaeon]MBT4320009.1 beta-lactamase family protein [Candidatus Bathyarchaeota archaeon]MBT4423844.1 beta-lactamase family protein [Candidatus Bathyarchaeota archaeon]MBT6606009.1 beta-lactamase family protein [Candidatus Bathyarchaeota archaeon]MBT7186406.1 beta-lactamase family protein [Candidatus Bathyarchaeota archaeon]